ncbi:TSC22 domain family protein 2-like [Salarias fasciatus]|uniref:TSC22 domain family protein 2-like n=1 Tax=Salarias fasciatus TaxID=181472 RepID=A0A672IT00_SALFA|nr:TSC22 domain family protein 2-like [Salarias fasciatus]
MSKMPVKKKSCFQITSVTQAQVAAGSIPDHTDGRDHPDEPRTKLCVEAQSNAGEPQDGQLPHAHPVNGGLSCNKNPGSGRDTPHNAGGSVPVSAASRPSAQSSITSTLPAISMVHAPMSSNCTSRFRVIKLDHGTGEPFRRGRWTCTDFYERDSDSNRTVDRLKPAGTPLNHTADRDSGLGSTSFSVITCSAFPVQVVGNASDSGYSASADHPSETLHTGYSLHPQTGSRVSAFQPPGCAHQAQVSVQPAAPHTVSSNSLNGANQGAMQQKVPVVAPAAETQQLGHSTHPEGLSQGPAHYHQHHFVSNAYNAPTTVLIMGPSFVITSAAAPGEQGQGGEEDEAQALLSQEGNLPAVTPISPRSVQQQVVSQNQPSGGLSIAPLSSTTSSPHTSGQNVPAIVPKTTSTPPSVPSQTFGIGGLVQPQGALGGVTASFSKQMDGWKKIDALPQNCGDVVAVKDDVKLFLSEDLGLSTPAANSLVGIHITMNADEDSTSTASVVAIDNKIEQAMDLVKNHLMFAVREEVEVLKEQIKELYERNSLLERENAVLKSLANSEQLNQLSSQLRHGSTPPHVTNATAILAHQGGGQSIPHQHNITSA